VKGNESGKLDESSCWPEAVVVIEPNEPNSRPRSFRKRVTLGKRETPSRGSRLGGTVISSRVVSSREKHMLLVRARGD
jgi:hypothetical protein